MLHAGGHALDLRHVINDGLMAIFFFVAGLEIKEELVEGQLSSVRGALLPALGALGGMVVPALIYTAWNRGGDGAAGWGIPMATDIAFAVGVMALLGRRVPSGLKVLLLALAIVDDIGAIVVIAIFYSDGVRWLWLGAAAIGLVAIVALRRAGATSAPVYALIGIGVWFVTLQSGVHATVAGVALGLLTPVSIAPRLRDALHPWTSYVVVPLFALANAGVAMSSGLLHDAATSPVTIGVLSGLVVGKFVGITATMAIAQRLGWGHLPADVEGRQVLGMAAIAGIGFTVSLFISDLAFDDARLIDEAKIGVLAATVVAAALGVALLLATPSRGDGGPPS